MFDDTPSRLLLQLLAQRVAPPHSPSSPVRFDCLFPNADVNVMALTRREMFLDETMIRHHLAEQSHHIGAIDSSRNGYNFITGLAFRVARRLGKRFAPQLGLDAEAVAEAWFNTIFTEFCTLVPLRHLARRLAREYPGAVALLPLGKIGFQYMQAWEANELESFYFAYALQKAGVPVAFIYTHPSLREQSVALDRFVMGFVPYPIWTTETVLPTTHQRSGKIPHVLVSAYIRGLAAFWGELETPLSIASSCFGIGPQPLMERNLIDAKAFRHFAVETVRQPADPAVPFPGHLFSMSFPHADFGLWLAEALAQASVTAAQRAKDLVAAHGFEQAHICDLYYFSSAFMADAVRRAGGTVTYWPHSANAAYENAHLPGRANMICAVTRPAVEKWKKKQPNMRYQVRSELMLAPCPGPQKLTPGAPLHVVIIGGSCSIRYLPLLDEMKNRDSYRQLFQGLAKLDDVKVVFKSRPSGEDMVWLKHVMGDAFTVEETATPPGKIDYPNMIFLCVSMGGSSLLEGLGRGIPAMIVRDFEIDDYSDIDPAFVTTGPTEFVLDAIKNCRDPAYMQALTERQIDWYRSITDFTHMKR